MRDCWVLVGFGPDPYCPQRPSCRPLARELISVPGRDSLMRTLVLSNTGLRLTHLYYLSAKIVQAVRGSLLYLTRLTLAFTRYCHCQYCTVYGIHRGGWVGGRILPNSRAIVLQQCGQCRRAGRMKGRLIRAQTTRSKTISCKGHVSRCPSIGKIHKGNSEGVLAPVPELDLCKIVFHFKASVHELIILILSSRPASPTLLQQHCTTIAHIQPPPPPPLAYAI